MGKDVKVPPTPKGRLGFSLPAPRNSAGLMLKVGLRKAFFYIEKYSFILICLAKHVYLLLILILN